MFGWRDGKVEGWKTLLFGWEKKWEDEKWSKYKFTIMSSLNKIKKVSHFLFKKLCMKYEHFKFFLKGVQAKGRWALPKKEKEKIDSCSMTV